ncbi:hypothetical protein ACFFQW_15670 [Umezawaea endophytica]|uniref:Uncharacterized protein n=1 Tax=Umezawaea endophytica TaxID=1654476 RepID=A0A9X2VI16_9PSEU|nr:hypothetical protein [Umezawaea endophytica]MCS7475388.1 hypothetical protein [Umezawaea endophytica]
MFATTPNGSAIYGYLGSPNNWAQVGGAGYEWAVTDGAIYGLTPNRQEVYRWVSGTTWTAVGGPADQIVPCP